MKKRESILSPAVKSSIVVFGLICAGMAQAQYDYQLVDHPGHTSTQVFGINDRGDVVGNGTTYASGLFVYALKKGTFKYPAPAAGYDTTSVTGISNSGVMVGSVVDWDYSIKSGFIRSIKGTYSVFDHPEALTFTQARAVNNKGLVTGIRDRASPPDDTSIVAFIYNPKSNTFTDIIPESDHNQSIAHGINSKGEVVGDAIFVGSDDPCNPYNTGFRARYGWWRATDGTMTYFRINGRNTAARGINDSGTIVGFTWDPVDKGFKGFKVELDGSQCQAITIASGDLLEIPGFVALYPEGISNSGVIVGSAFDGFTFHGFVAKPW